MKKYIGCFLVVFLSVGCKEETSADDYSLKVSQLCHKTVINWFGMSRSGQGSFKFGPNDEKFKKEMVRIAKEVKDDTKYLKMIFDLIDASVPQFIKSCTAFYNTAFSECWTYQKKKDPNEFKKCMGPYDQKFAAIIKEMSLTQIQGQREQVRDVSSRVVDVSQFSQNLFNKTQKKIYRNSP